MLSSAPRGLDQPFFAPLGPNSRFCQVYVLVHAVAASYNPRLSIAVHLTKRLHLISFSPF
jgi:hypothetical protein